MPSLVLTGHPSSGKTTLAHVIRDRALRLLDTTIRKVVLLNEEHNCPDHTKSACYFDSHTEKKTRAALKAAFDREVSSAQEPGTLVILDSLNYIKGFRYELHCISKAANDLHGIVWVLNDVEVCKEWNKKRQDAYTEEQLQELVLRYEPPDERNRWDHPLYRVDMRPRDVSLSCKSTAKDVLERSVYNMHKLSDAIDAEGSVAADHKAEAKAASESTATKKPSAFRKSAFKRRAAPKPTTAVETPAITETKTLVAASESANTAAAPSPKNNQQLSLEERVDQMLKAFLSQRPLEESHSTRRHMAADANCLPTVDAVTNRVVSSLMAAQNQSATSVVTQYQVAYSSSEQEERLPWKAPSMSSSNMRLLSMAALKRLRRQYIEVVQSNPPRDSSERGIAVSFLEYIAQVHQSR